MNYCTESGEVGRNLTVYEFRLWYKVNRNRGVEEEGRCRSGDVCGSYDDPFELNSS